ncbi:hypothetical protein GCM10029964_063820 [Kibdelosporangium lantanae]
MRRVAASGLADGVILMDVELGDKRIPTLRGQGTQAALIGLPDDPVDCPVWTTTSSRPARSARTTWPTSATGRSP